MTAGLLDVVESAIFVLNKERNVHFEALPQTEGTFQSDVVLETEIKEAGSKQKLLSDVLDGISNEKVDLRDFVDRLL